ncbi:MAG: hypothetical protein ACT6Q5_13990 [Sphingopyxis solisilvae]|uniref:hypothetical protein n=1 Tax=Sphingopyxis solisilvae TaxID=1886788 RepID=UPI0040368E98
MIGDVPGFVAEVDGAAQEQFGAGCRRAARDRAGFAVDDILVAPGDMVALVHDVQADRQAGRRVLAVEVAVGAVEAQLALAELAAPGEGQVQRLVVAAVDRFGIELIIVAEIAGAEIADGEEVEIMVVRDAVGEGGGAAGPIGGVGRGGPDVGAQIPAARAAVEEDDLRRIAAGGLGVGGGGCERGDEVVGEEAAVALEAGEEGGAAVDAGFVGEVDAVLVEGRGDFGEGECGTGGAGLSGGAWEVL